MCDKQSFRGHQKKIDRMVPIMSRKERRKQGKKRSKGGSPVVVSRRGYYSGDPIPLILKTASKCIKDQKMENILRSKNVPGY